MHERLTKLRQQMAGRSFDALLITDLSNVFYLTGFTGSAGVVIVTPANEYILVDPRYTAQAKTECPTCVVVEYSARPASAAIGEFLNDQRPNRVGYEADHVSVSFYRAIRAQVEPSISMRSSTGIVELLRRIKDVDEVAIIRQACEIADNTFSSLIHDIKIGMTEKETALLVDTTLRRLGADKEAFQTIAASGVRAACPHAAPTGNILKEGMLLKLDFGARYHNYNSDITRTICMGEPDAKQREIYNIVLEAQLRSTEAIAPGKPGREVDATAREFIASKGYGANFGHGLGHALGIEVHDGPALSQTSDVVLEPGMVVTVEPGIYLDGWGGIRIEDDVLVTESGYCVLTHSTKELLSIS